MRFGCGAAEFEFDEGEVNVGSAKTAISRISFLLSSTSAANAEPAQFSFCFGKNKKER